MVKYYLIAKEKSFGNTKGGKKFKVYKKVSSFSLAEFDTQEQAKRQANTLNRKNKYYYSVSVTTKKPILKNSVGYEVGRYFLLPKK